MVESESGLYEGHADQKTTQTALMEQLPPPVFTGPMSVSDSTLNDLLYNMLQLNAARLQEAHQYQGLFTQPRIADFIFVACEKLNLSAEVRHRSLLIFDEFMLEHVQEVHGVAQQGVRDWLAVEARLTNQLTLRALSAVQIASKLESCYEFARVDLLCGYLRQVGQCYTREQLQQSEMRMIRQLHFHIQPLSPVDYVQVLLRLLATVIDGVDVVEYWQYSVHWLDYMALNARAVYTQLLVQATGCEAQHVSLARIAYLRADYMLLACGVLAAAACCVQSLGRFTDKVCEQLSMMTKQPLGDIHEVCAALLHHVLMQ